MNGLWRTLLIGAVLCSALASCGERAASAPPADPLATTLRQLADRADAAAAAGESLLRQEATAKISFCERVRGRVDSLRAFIHQAGSADPGARDLTVQRGNALFNDAGVHFDEATTLLAGLAPVITHVLGHGDAMVSDLAVIGGAEAPLHVRYDAWTSDRELGLRHVTEALTKIAAGAREGATEFKVAEAAFRRADADGARLRAEIAAASSEMTRADQRRTLFAKRRAWAEMVAAKCVPGTVPAAATAALAAARALDGEALDREVADVKHALANTLPDASGRARAMAEKIDAQTRTLTAAWLDLARGAGVPDPDH